MTKIQIALKLDKLTDQQLIGKANDIVAALTTNAADYTGITPSVADITTAIAAGATAVTDADNLATAAAAAIITKNDKLAVVAERLTKAAKWTEANITDPAVAAKVFTLKKGATPAPADLAQVINLMLDFGATGKLKASWLAVERAKTYEVQMRYRDVAGSVWTTVKTLSPTKYTLAGLTSGQVVQVRVRAIGPKGLEGDWSDLAEHIVP